MGFLKNLRKRKQESSTIVVCELCNRQAIAGRRFCLDHSDYTLCMVYVEARKQMRVVEDQRTQSKKKK